MIVVQESFIIHSSLLGIDHDAFGIRMQELLHNVFLILLAFLCGIPPCNSFRWLLHKRGIGILKTFSLL